MNEPITLFEHECLRTDRGEQTITVDELKALQTFYGDSGVPYYSLIPRGVRFNEYVGVIQIGDLIIEILPKVDKSDDKERWKYVLFDMLQAVGKFKIHAPSKSSLNIRQCSILELYLELFINEVEYLIRRGLIKKYRKTEGNSTSLKGSIQFAKNISHNLVHKERFYVRHLTYDTKHNIHAILFKTLKLLSTLNINSHLNRRLKILLLRFPLQNNIKATEALFNNITTDRKTNPYIHALEIAKLILLNYHPDVTQGANNVLALMFNMNDLWEQFVFTSLRRHKTKTTKIYKTSKNFWKPLSGSASKLKPDIVLNKGKEGCVVLDTKWKDLKKNNPSIEDLRQMFVYMRYYRAKKVSLVYPGVSNIKSGYYYDHKTDFDTLSHSECSIISIGIPDDIKNWQRTIHDNIDKWIDNK